MIFTISFARAALPQMVVAFIIPVIIGMLLGVLGKNTGIEEVTVSLLLVSFMMVIPILTLRHARILTQHVITEIAMREQKNIIGLLLNEFEENSSDCFGNLMIKETFNVLRTVHRCFALKLQKK